MNSHVHTCVHTFERTRTLHVSSLLSLNGALMFATLFARDLFL